MQDKQLKNIKKRRRSCSAIHKQNDDAVSKESKPEEGPNSKS